MSWLLHGTCSPGVQLHMGYSTYFTDCKCFFDDDDYFYSHYVSVRLCNENPGVDLASIYAVFAGPRTSPSSGGGGRAPFPTSGWLWSIMLIASFTIGVIFASDERRLSACSGLSKQYY